MRTNRRLSSSNYRGEKINNLLEIFDRGRKTCLIDPNQTIPKKLVHIATCLACSLLSLAQNAISTMMAHAIHETVANAIATSVTEPVETTTWLSVTRKLGENALVLAVHLPIGLDYLNMHEAAHRDKAEYPGHRVV